MRIHTFDVGPGHPCFVVAEFGSNHAGSLDIALALIDAAADAGANAVKGQLWTSADEMYDKGQFPEEWATTEKYKLPVEWLPRLRDRAHERGLAFGLSSFGFASLDEADKWVDFHKVASIEADWPDLFLAVVNKDKPMIVSTGMRNDTLTTMFTDEVVFLGCTVSYPCDLGDVHIASMPRSDHMWGLSDHTLHPTIAPCAAVALGACVVEKHIRGEDHLPKPRVHGPDECPPDWYHSLHPSQFKEMVHAIRLTEQALGTSEKRIRKSEKPYLRFKRGPRGLRGA